MMQCTCLIFLDNGVTCSLYKTLELEKINGKMKKFYIFLKFFSKSEKMDFE